MRPRMYRSDCATLLNKLLNESLVGRKFDALSQCLRGERVTARVAQPRALESWARMIVLVIFFLSCDDFVSQ